MTIFILMKTLNRNRTNILLLFTRNPFAKTTTEELEFYTSDDEELLGFVVRDRIDGTFMLFCWTGTRDGNIVS